MSYETYREDLDRLATTQDIKEAIYIILSRYLCYGEIKKQRPNDYKELIERFIQFGEDEDINTDTLNLPNGLSDEEQKRDLIIDSLNASDDFLVDLFHNKFTYQDLCDSYGQEQVKNFFKEFHGHLREYQIDEDDGENVSFDHPAMLGGIGHLPTSTGSLGSTEPKKSLKVGITLTTGVTTDVALSFHFLKEDLRFFLKDLPFELPGLPSEPQFDANAYYHLKEFPIGMTTEDVQHNSTENTRLPVPGLPIRAIATQDGYVLRDSFDAPVTLDGGAALSYGPIKIHCRAYDKWNQYRDQFDKGIMNYRAEINKYNQAMAAWEWTVFRKARTVADKVHWAKGVTLDGIKKATKKTGLKPLFMPDYLKKKLEDAKLSMHHVR